jgi:hypothetical protein
MMLPLYPSQLNTSGYKCIRQIATNSGYSPSVAFGAGHYRIRVVDAQGQADSREVVVEAVP